MRIKILTIICLIFFNNGLTAEELEQGIFTFAGYTDLTFTDSEDQKSTAYKLAPIFLIQPSDRFHIEAEFEFRINDSGETEAEVEYLDIHYFASDTITLTAGKILLPFAHFGPHLHPSWINKLPTQPAIYGGHHGDESIEGLMPILSDVGITYQQVVPISSRHRFFIDAFVTNGPAFSPLHSEHGPEEAIAGHDDDAVAHEDDLTHNDEEEEHHDDEADAGHEEAADQEQFSFAPPELRFPGKLHDNNSSKAFGGRIAYAYLPGFEAGFSYYRGAYDDTGNLDFKAEAIDLT